MHKWQYFQSNETKLTIGVLRRLQGHLPGHHGDAIFSRVPFSFDHLFLLIVQDQLDAVEDVAVLGVLAAWQVGKSKLMSKRASYTSYCPSNPQKQHIEFKKFKAKKSDQK